MSEPPKKRACFQLHLSTCVVLMVAAGALAGLNTQDRYSGPAHTHGFLEKEDGEIQDLMEQPEYFGWPSAAMVRHGVFILTNDKDCIDLPAQSEISIRPAGLVADAIAAMGILTLLALATEMLLRRRARKRAAPPGPN